MFFEKALAFVLAQEGGYVNNSHDLGHATNFGITQETYDRVRTNHNLPTKNVKYITPEEVAAIYQKVYWDANNCGSFSHKVGIALFDWAVNSGDEAAIHLQRIVGVTQDGKIGPITIREVKIQNEATLLSEYLESRVAFYKQIVAMNPSQQVFIKGWLARVDRLRDFINTITPVST